MDKKAVVLLSGGLDSSTCCAIAKSKGFEIYAMSFAYGQRHHVELSASTRVAAFFNVKEHRVVTIDFAAFGDSSLTSTLEVPKDRLGKKHSGEIPNTYVPARNTIFLSFALGWAEVLECGDIFIGVNALDYSGYPDCRPEYITAFQAMANLATKAAVEGQRLAIHTPLINLTKAQIIRLGVNSASIIPLPTVATTRAPKALHAGHATVACCGKKGLKKRALKM